MWEIGGGFVSGLQTNQWWHAQLAEPGSGVVCTVQQIKIYQRADSCCDQRLNNAQVTLYNTLSVSVWKGTIDGSDTISVFDLPVGTQGNRVEVSGSNGRFDIMELEVYGSCA